MKIDSIPELNLKLGNRQRVVELLRPWVLFLFYIITALKGWWLIAVPLAIVTCLAAFVQMHDAIHRSLGLSVKVNGLVLTLSALLILKSGHGLQVTHLRHHGRCLEEDDPEGAPANWPLHRVMLDGPMHMFTLRVHALKLAPNRSRIQFVETALTLLIILSALAGFFWFNTFIGLVYWLVVAGISASMPLWAAYIPHRLDSKNPAVKIAASIARVWTPVISSFAYHHIHHAYAKIPTVLLPEAARILNAEQIADLEHSHNQNNRF